MRFGIHPEINQRGLILKHEYISESISQTEQLGFMLAKKLVPGDCIAFTGDLGAGKTVFCRGIARGLGYKGNITSPTFSIVNEYQGEKYSIAHFDMYRIGNEDQLYSTGFYDYLDSGYILLIEWSENISDLLDFKYIHVDIQGSGDEPRHITVEEV